MILRNSIRSAARVFSAAVLLAFAAAGCDFFQRKNPGAAGGEKPAAADAPWTSERMAADPAGFLSHAVADTAGQIAARRERIAKIGEFRAETTARAKELADAADTIASLRKRLSTAVSRADENDSWPISFATLSLDRKRAAAILEGAEREAGKFAPLSAEYASTLDKLAAAESACREEIRNLEILGEKLALRRRQVELNREAADLAEMGRSAEELSILSETLSSSSSIIDLDALPRPSASLRTSEPELAPFLP